MHLTRHNWSDVPLPHQIYSRHNKQCSNEFTLTFLWYLLNKFSACYFEWLFGAADFERQSGRLCPLTAPFPFWRPPAPAPLHSIFLISLTATFRSVQVGFRPSPLRFPLRSRSAYMLCRKDNGYFPPWSPGGDAVHNSVNSSYYSHSPGGSSL